MGDLLVLEEIGVARVAALDAVLLPDLIELVLRALADRHELDMRMALVDGDELRPEPEPNDRDPDLPARCPCPACHAMPPGW